MIRMLVTDLDGTLLTDDKHITARSRDAIARCQSMGIRHVIATARPRRTVLPLLEGLRPDAVLLHNGAIREIDGCPDPAPHFIPYEEAEAILQKLQAEPRQWMASIEIHDQLYANYDVSPFWKYVGCIQTDFTDLPHKDAEKLLIHTPTPEDFRHVEALLPDDLYAQLSDSRMAMIMHKDATKPKAIRALAEYWGIDPSEILAFGDDLNDKEMLQAAGTGVAMGNALPEVKAAANAVTADNENDGVAVYLETYILSRI